MMKNLFYLLIVCGVLCQLILGSIADEDISKPSDVLVRHKRVFHLNRNRDITVTIQHAPYIVNIKTINGTYESSHCVGSIITAHAIITAAQCAGLSIEKYAIYSESRFSHTGTYHRVINKKIHINSTHRNGDGIALMFVNPHFTLASSSSSPGAGFIALRHNRPIPPRSVGTVSGWGYRCTSSVVPEPIVSLKSINVRVLNNVDCANRWQGLIQISPRDICTFDANKHCGHSDLGAPLVIDRQLVGVHLYSGGLFAGVNPKPDIFAFLDHPEYLYWVRENIMAHTK